MKPILPKGPCLPQVHSILSSPRTTIILAPQMAPTFTLGAPLSSSFILPSPPTSTITLSAHRVPQPTPVILPLNKTSAASSSVHLPGPLLVPKSDSSRTVAEAQSSVTSREKKSNPKKHSIRKARERENTNILKKKSTLLDTGVKSILPKGSPSDTHTLILLPAPGTRKKLSMPPSTLLVSKGSLMNCDAKLQNNSPKKKNDRNTNNNNNNNNNNSNNSNNNNNNNDNNSLLKLKQVAPDYFFCDNTVEPCSKTKSQTKSAASRSTRRKNTARQRSSWGEGEIKHVNNSKREDESIKEDNPNPAEDVESLYSSEPYLLSADGCLHLTSHFSSEEDVPCRPPPPYPQDTVRSSNSNSWATKTCEGQKSNKLLKDASTHQSCGQKSSYVMRKKSEGKPRRKCDADSLPAALSSIPMSEKKTPSVLNSISDINRNHSSVPTSSSLLTSDYNQSYPAVTLAGITSGIVTVGKNCPSITTVASSCLSPISHSYLSPSMDKSLLPTVGKSDTTAKTLPSYQLPSPLPASPCTSLDGAQTLRLSSVKSQNRSSECSYLSSATSQSISVWDIPPTEVPYTPTSVSHTSFSPSCSRTPSVVTHLPQSSTCSFTPLYSGTQEAHSGIPASNHVESYESKSVSYAVSSQTTVPFTESTIHTQGSFSPHLDICEQTSSSAFYLQSSQAAQCNQSVHPMLHSHSSASSEGNFSSTCALSYHMCSRVLSDQPPSHKVSSHPAPYAESPLPSPYIQPTSYMQSPHPPSYTQSPQPTSFSQSPQPKLYSQSPQPTYMHSPQPPSYIESSKTSPYAQSHTTLNTMLDQSESHIHSPQPAVCGQSPHPSYISVQNPNSCLDTEHNSPYLHPAQPLALSGGSDADPHSPQAISFSSGYTLPYCTPPQRESHCQSSQTPPLPVENLSAVTMFRDNSQSPILPPYSVPPELSSSNFYTNSSGMSYTPEQTNSVHDTHYYTGSKFKPLTPSPSIDVNSSHFISLERSLSPPSYEAHLQNTASYIASESNAEIPHNGARHTPQQTSPTNYSLSSHIIRNQDTSPLRSESKKNDNSPAYPPSPSLLPPPPPPRYTCNRQITGDSQIDPSIIADFTQGAYDYGIEESSQAYFPPTPLSAPLPSADDSQTNIELPDSEGYCASQSHSESHDTGIYLPSQAVESDTNGQSRLQNSQNKLYTSAKHETLYKHSNQDFVISNWSNSARGTGTHNSESQEVHNMIERAEKLWFIPHQEQNRVYMKRKELARNLLSHPDLHSSRDMMLKEKFWIEEDEPIAEEILSSLSNQPRPEEQPAADGGSGEAAAPDTHALQQGLHSKTKKTTREMLCQICGKMLRGRSSLKSHLNSHNNIQPHSCPTCAKSFTNRSVLVEHLRIHTGELPYLCSLCDAAFRTRSGLFRHKSMHTSTRPHECSMCSKTFKTKLVLQHHMKLHLTGLFTCSDCGKTFERHKSLAVHKAFHHHKPQRFRCPKCPKEYHFLSLLSRHMQLHDNIRKHICSVCNESFVWRSGLAAHMKTHSTSRPQCDICGVRFASEKRLESHYRRHSNPQPHHCKVCGRNFSHAYRLASHSLVHQEHKEYTCHKCNITFTSAKKFRKHLVTHKKEEPRICRLSGTVAASKSL